jgi:hypothetical protein
MGVVSSDAGDGAVGRVVVVVVDTAPRSPL